MRRTLVLLLVIFALSVQPVEAAVISYKCMMDWLTYQRVPTVYRDSIAKKAANRSSAYSLHKTLKASDIPSVWIDVGIWSYYKCGEG